MADSIVKLRIDSQEYDAKIKNASQALSKYFDTVKSGGGTLAHLDEGVLDAVKAMGEMETKSGTLKGRIGEMTQAFTELHSRYQQFTAEEKASPIGQEMSKSLDTLKTRIAESKTQLNDVNKELGNTSAAGSSAGSVLEDLAGKFGLNVTQLTKFATVAGVATAALKVSKDAFFESETNVDEWGRTVEASGSIYQSFLQTINNGDFSGFLTGIGRVIQAAKDAYNAIDELNTRMTIINPERAKLQAQQTELKAIIRRKGADSEEGKKAAQQLRALEPQLAKSFDKEAQMNADAFKAKVKERLAEGGITLSDKEMGAFMATMSDDRLFQQFRAKAKGSQGTKVVGETEYSEGYISSYDTRNKNAKLIDLFTDEWRQQNSQYLTAAYNARGQAASTRLGNARYLKDGGGTGSGSGGSKGGNKTDTYVPAEGSIDAQTEKVQKLQKAWRAAADDDSRETIKKQITAAQAELDAMQGKMDRGGFIDLFSTKIDEGKIKNIETTPLSSLNKYSIADNTNSSLSAFISGTQSEIQNSEIGSNLYEKLTEQLKDANMMSDIIKMAIEGGVKGADLSSAAQALKDALLDGDISEDEIQKILDQINAGIENEEFKIKLTADGSLTTVGKENAKQAKEMADQWKGAASAVSAVGSAMQQIEDPAAKVIGTVAQAIATVALGYAQATEQASKLGPWAWIAFAATGLATMISTIASIHSATGYAQGGIVQGNSYSGDNIGGLVDGSQLVGLNAGEVVLTRAMAGNLAEQLSGNSLPATGGGQPYVTGEMLFLAMNNYGRRTGRGEIVMSRR